MYLDKIAATKREEVAALKQSVTLKQLEQAAAARPAALGFEQALRAPNRTMGLIAEVKKASPSKGLIWPDFDPVALAKSYERAGADCLSVLTDVQYFQGNNEYLSQIREAVQLPILRKDFTIDPWQIVEARAIGADAVLLIAAMLTTETIAELIREARELGMDALVEVHSREELERVLDVGATMIGINNRNLHTFVTDLAVTEQLIELIPEHALKVSESGIAGRNDIERLQSAGAEAVLIGEHFMRQASVEQAVIDLLGAI